MKTNDVKQKIQRLAKNEFILYPDSFPVVHGVMTTECIENISQWALNMWDSRTDEEIETDIRLGLNADVYIVWAFEAFRKITT